MMRNRDLLHIQHTLRLLKRHEREASFNQDGAIQIGNRTISYIRMTVGNGTVGGYQVIDASEPTSSIEIETTRSFHKAVEALLDNCLQ